MMRPLAMSAVLAALALAACDGPAPVPPPQEVSDSSVAQFCGMLVSEHEGPKGQIFVRGQSKPFWFASVNDAVAFLRMEETPKNIVVVYVNDMARAHDWAHPEPGTWIDAKRAIYVINSRKHGGMHGADGAEAVPFGDRVAAKRFVAQNGGQMVTLAGIPDSVLHPDAESGS